ncbi:hypothetical protein GCM10009654_57450 [Streptomyces hebeiensis]|uniref:Uncharacterized protein n=1 Tax=Streptomyces hebeiensis TaxID=229486 RepID=A0ABP4FP52_9ACTN
MSTTVAPSRAVERWTPPLDADGLRNALERIRAWRPLDVEDVFDDLDAAIGDQPLPAATTAELIARLRSHLKRLSDIAIAGPPPRRPPGGPGWYRQDRRAAHQRRRSIRAPSSTTPPTLGGPTRTERVRQ